MSTEAPLPRQASAPVGAIVVFAIAVVFYAGMVGCLSDIHGGGQDAAGRGFASAFAALFGIILWIFLGILLLIGGTKGSMPMWAGIAVAFLWLLSGIAAMMALDLYERDAQWVYIVPIALPPLIAGYGLWARLIDLHRAFPEHFTSALAIGMIAALSLAPLPPYIARERAYAERRAEERAEERAKQEEADKRHAEALARFQKLTPDSPLWEWAKFFGKDSEFDAQAIDGAKHLTHLQADAEEALRRDLGFPLDEYYRLDLKGTPALCAAASGFLIRAANARQTPPTDADDRSTEDFFDPYLGGIEWLTQTGCDLDAAVTRIEQIVLAAPTTGSRDGFLGILQWRHGNGFMKRQDYLRAYASYTAALHYEPGNAQFYEYRGSILYNQEKYADAIGDYSDAIRYNQGYSTAYNARGAAYHEAGDDDNAMADYDKAIELNPGFARAHDNRGLLYIAKGNFDKAVEDESDAIGAAPRFAAAWFNRGRARYHQGSYLQATDDIGTALRLTPDYAYYALWLYLARTRAAQPDDGQFRKDTAKLDRGEWPWPVVAAYLGETDSAVVLSDSRTDKNHECEADFYFGAKAQVGGDATTARDLFLKALAICPRNFIETAAARLELEKLPP